MSNAVVEIGPAQRSALLEPNSIEELQRLGQLFSASGFFADAKQMAQAAVKIMAGRELGMPPLASMVGISIIAGKPVMGANLIAAAMKRDGYTWEVPQRDADGCKLVLSYKGKEVGRTEFLKADAERAGLLGKDNWRKFPRSMFFARAISDAARTFAPEVFGGIPPYTAEELGMADTGEDGAPVAIEAKAEPAPAKPVFDGGLDEFEKAFRGATKFGRLKAFGELKGRLRDDAKYYQILAIAGVGHANEFKTVGPAWMAARMLYEQIEAAESKSDEPASPDVADGDVPFGGVKE